MKQKLSHLLIYFRQTFKLLLQIISISQLVPISTHFQRPQAVGFNIRNYVNFHDVSIIIK